MGFFKLSSISSRVLEARQRNGFSQSRLGEMVGTSQQVIANIEKGKTSYSKYINPISKALGVSYEWLMYGNSEGIKASNDELDSETFIAIANESLSRAINSMKVINEKKGVQPNIMDEQLLKKAFEISIKGQLSGDFLLTALEFK